MNPEEMGSYIGSRFEKDLGTYKRLISEEKERFNKIRNTAGIQPLLIKVRTMYEDLIADGYLKKDYDMFRHEAIEYSKSSQARKEAASLLKELEGKQEHYKIIFGKGNRVYVILYENLIQSYLVPLAQRLNGKPIVDKAKVLDALIKYKGGKHAEVFRSLIPQIRNSIQHVDCFIDKKKPQITFYDRRKEPLILAVEEYWAILFEAFLLAIAFDIVTFDITYPFYEYFIEQLDVVQEYLKKNGLKYKRSDNAPLSLLDWATQIKSGKV